MSKTPATDNWRQVKRTSEAALPAEIVRHIEICRKDLRPESQLIGVLHKVQAHYGHLGPAQLDAVAQLLQIPAATVTGVATFYHFFRLTPRGKFVINVCLGTACYVRGADKLVEKLRDELGIEIGQTTPDGMFTLEASRCLGTCGLAPVVMFNDHVHAKVQPDQIPVLIGQYMQQARSQEGG